MAYNGHNWVNDGPPAINADNLNEMDNEIVYLSAKEIANHENTVPLAIGTWTSDGITVGTKSNTRIRTLQKVSVADIYSIKVPTGWQAYPFYLQDDTLLNEPSWITGTILKSSMPDGTNFININFRKTGETTSDISSYINVLYKSIVITHTTEQGIKELESEVETISTGAVSGYGTSNVGIDTFISLFGNADSAPKQRVISVSTRENYDLTDYNFPVNVSGVLTTMSKSYTTSSHTGTYQYYFTSENQFFFRFSYGTTYSDWVEIHKDSSTISMPKVDLAMFETIAIIGDSFASGSVSVNTEQTNFALSWIQNLGRKYGIKATNYSKGGLTTRTWMTSSYGLPKLRADTGKLLYFIALGINDSNPDSRNVPVGNQSDFTTTTDTPDTFYGNMGIIYREILLKNSAAIICWVTPPRFGTRYDPYSAAIRNMATMTGMILIDSNEIPMFKTSWWLNNLSNTNHPSAPLYNAMANVYANEFSRVAENQYMSLLNNYGGFINNDPDEPGDPEDPEV